MKYSIVQQPNQKGTKFTVDEETGEVSTNKVFDREGDDGKFVSVTVKATDQGEPSLEGVCSFTVEITDVNDNPPLFDRQVCKKRRMLYFRFVEVIFFNFSIFRNMLKMLNKMRVSALIYFECPLQMKMLTIMELLFIVYRHHIILKISIISKYNRNLVGSF